METVKSTTETTNSLIFNATHTVGKYTYKVKIRLNDECKNGIEDFSITGEIWNGPITRNERNLETCGAIGDKIAAKFPQYQIFETLHLCNFNGTPMYAVSNGFYHLRYGLGNTPTNSPEFKSEYCKYYRITPEQFDIIAGSEDKDVFGYYLHKLGIYEQWKNEADQAIKILEEWTGKKFKSLANSDKLMSDKLTPEKNQKIEQLMSEGHFTPEKIEQRIHEAKQSRIAKKRDEILFDFHEKVEKEKIERDINLCVLLAGYESDNFIYYNHTNKLVFNWQEYNTKHFKFTESDVSAILSYGNEFRLLPQGITTEIK